MTLEGGVAFITGAGSGMGQLAARNMAEGGARVAALDVDEEGLGKTAAGCEGVTTFLCDVTDADALEAVSRQVESELGPIDRVYAAAGIMPTSKLLEQELGTIHGVMEINYGGVVNTTRATLPGMLERGRGDMVIFASMAGWQPVLLLGAYNASKFAVVAFTEVLYHECRNRGVRFACVCPPRVTTPLLDQARGAWPKSFDKVQPIAPQDVLDAIDATLDSGKFWVFPGRGTKLAWRARRWLPEFIWKQVHRIEGW